MLSRLLQIAGTVSNKNKDMNMLVTFSNRLSGDITMFGDIAIQLLKLMGHSGTVPSALSAEDVPAALAKLENAIDDIEPLSDVDLSLNEDEQGDPVSLAHRAIPLIEMLQTSARDKSYIMWADNS